MRRSSIAVLVVVCAGVLGCVGVAPASAQSPWWRINSTSRPSSLQPGKTGVLVVIAENVGDAPLAAGEPVAIDDTLPGGLRATGASAITVFSNEAGAVPCALREAGAAVTCTFSGGASELPGNPTEKSFMEKHGLPSFQEIEVRIPVQVSAGAAVCEPHSLACERNIVDVSGGGAPAASVSRPVVVSALAPAFGVADDEFDPEEEGGGIDTQAASHPFQTGFEVVLNQDLEEGVEGSPGRPAVHPVALAKDLRFKLPAGFVGNPTAIPQCPISKFMHKISVENAELDECPADTAVGVATTGYLLPRSFGYRVVDLPLFNLEPQAGEPARFGFFVPEGGTGIGVFIDTAVRTGEDYGVTSTSANISQLVAFAFAKVTLWGVPGDPRHNNQRGWGCLGTSRGPIPGLSCTGLESSHPPPFLDLPSSCTGPLQTSVEADSWQDPGHFESFGSEPIPGMEGCNHLRFAPEIKVTPDTSQASTPTGINVEVQMPQEGQLNPEGLAQSTVKSIEVTLPAGVSLDPSAAEGLQACTANTGSPLDGRLGVPGDQVGYEGVRAFPLEPGVSAPAFTPYKPQSTDALTAGYSETLQPGVNFCPEASKVATVKITTPLLPNPVTGAMYLASPQNFNVFPPENPFATHLAMYLIAEDPVSGSLVKLPGRVELGGEPGANSELAPGQIRSYFEDNPQLPFEDAEVRFFGGERAPLATPDHCGTYTTQATYTPWDGGPPTHASSSFQITTGPNGSPCPGASLPFNTELHSSVSPINAASFTALSTTLSRPSGDQNIQSVTLHYPPGLSGLLTGVSLCGEPQANDGTCPQSSEIGESTVSVGVGGQPYTVTGGAAYITGPFNGTGACTVGQAGCAPFGLSIVTPAKAGPFDLQQGQPVIVRAKIEIDPLTAALTITTNGPSQPYHIPTIIEGFPLPIEHINVLTNRPGFTFNPTNCNRAQTTGQINAAEGATTTVSAPFQITNCQALKFTPKFTVTTSGKTSKANGASLTTRLEEPAGALGTQANIAKVKVELPIALPSRLTTLQKACTQAQFQTNPAGCPPESIIGHATVHTPVLPVPLQGPAYFVSNGGEEFPNLIMVLQGYGVQIELVGDTRIHKGITSTTFKAVPDQPFNTFELTLPQGPYSALTAYGNLCKKKLVMPNEFTAQNGAEIHQNTPITVQGCKPAIHITSHHTNHHTITLTITVPTAGTLTATAKGLTTTTQHTNHAGTITIKLHPTKTQTTNPTHHHTQTTKINLTFKPQQGTKLHTNITIPNK